jgi:signal transduction histidine kinase/CheY-like chemotaxis protein
VWFLPRSISLAAQLVLVLASLVVAATTVLTIVAYRSSVDNLEAGARSAIRAAVRDREQVIVQLLAARRRSAEGLLASARSLCSESISATRLGWSIDCMRPMIDEFRTAEHALRSEVWYRQRPIIRSGGRVSRLATGPDRVGGIIRDADGPVGYQIQVNDDDLTLVADFDLEEFVPLFKEPIGLDGSSIFLVDEHGRSLVPQFGPEATPMLSNVAARDCLAGSAEGVASDPRRGEVFHAFQPVTALGPVCIAATIPVSQALAPAEILRQQLIWRGVAFTALGVLLSLLAARWIAAPVRRLASAAEKLRQGKFEHSISVAGPSEVRALGLALRAMASDLDRRITREQMAREEAQDAATAKDHFIAMISHELRTPLGAMLGWSEVLRQGQLDESARIRALESIHRSAEAQKRLLDDLLDVSRIGTKQLRLASTTIDFSRAAEAAVESLRPIADEKNVRLDFRSDDRTLLVRGDAERLQQVVWNLTSNSVKFTPSGGSVQVAVQRSGDSATLTVADTGIGISGTLLPHIFEWFRQGDSARTRRYSGLGIGLGIVRQIVELHGGAVHAESAGEGRGAMFIVTLPLVEVSAVTSVTRPTDLNQPMYSRRLEGVRVLLVEDDNDMREMVAAALETAGAFVRAVASAIEARQSVNESVPDVLISDIAMPTEDGYSLIRTLRQSGVNVPAIALTAYARGEDIEEAKTAGFQLHLAKPVTPTQVIDAVAELAVVRHA